ncbi:hypothetical protein ACFO6W_10930, partial [Dysgonomonas termitidis]
QLMILKGNGFRSGGSLNPEVVAAVDKELEEEGKMKSEEPEVKSEELKVKNEQGQVMEQQPVAQPSAAPVEKPKPKNLYPFLPPGYTSRTD